MTDPVKTSKSTKSEAGVKTPKQIKSESDAASRAAEREAIEAQVAQDQAVFDAAVETQTAAHDKAVKTEAEAFSALTAASAISDPPPVDPTDQKAVAAREKTLAANAALVAEAFQAQEAAKKAREDLDKANVAVAQAKDALVASQAKANSLAATSENSPWYYCLESSHQGDLKSISRFFQSDDLGCPVCPEDKRQVPAVPADGFGIYPPGILVLHERLTAGGRV